MGIFLETQGNFFSKQTDAIKKYCFVKMVVEENFQ